MWLRPWTNGPIPGCKCGHTFTGQHNRTICHRVQVYTCSRSPEPTSTFSSLVPQARPFTGFKSHTAFSLYICPNPFDILFYPIIYINITICLSIFSFNLSRNKAHFSVWWYPFVWLWLTDECWVDPKTGPETLTFCRFSPLLSIFYDLYI